jgi:hypothetical protein
MHNFHKTSCSFKANTKEGAILCEARQKEYSGYALTKKVISEKALLNAKEY